MDRQKEVFSFSKYKKYIHERHVNLKLAIIINVTERMNDCRDIIFSMFVYQKQTLPDFSSLETQNGESNIYTQIQLL